VDETRRVGHAFGISTKAEAATAAVPGFSMLRLARVRSLLIPELHSAISGDKEHIAIHGAQTVHRDKIGLSWTTSALLGFFILYCPFKFVVI
jgi:hypothetical protein